MLFPTMDASAPSCLFQKSSLTMATRSAVGLSSAAMNPALTIASQALRVADHLTGKPILTSQLSNIENTKRML